MFIFNKKISFKEEDLTFLYEKVRSKNSVFFQSGSLGRYSIIGYDPYLVFEAYESKNDLFNIKVSGIFNEEKDGLEAEEVLDLLHLSWKRKVETPNLGVSTFDGSIPFYGGMLGFFSYDFGVKFSKIKQKVKDDVGYPSCYFIFPRKIFVFDNEEKKMCLFSLDKDEENAKIGLKEMAKIITNYELRITNLEISNSKFQVPNKSQISNSNDQNNAIISNLTLSEYISKVKKVKDYLRKGHTYQVNFSQRFEVSVLNDPFEIYKKVTKINPSPFQGYFEGNDFAIMSNSPERLVRAQLRITNYELRDMIIEMRPIKGTMPRSKDPKKDQFYLKKLLNSEKDKAELAMIVDLQRNDIGKICKIGTVEVNEDRVTEGYSHLWHTMSNIRGVLDSKKDFRDVIKAVFPGGSITGCPKIRTMEIIDELEEFKRGVYTGSLGYICFNGNSDFNIMIRTMFYKKGKIYSHFGGGIVIDSDPKKEYDETITKARAIIEGIRNLQLSRKF